MSEKVTLQSFFTDVVVPKAKEAKAWRTEQASESVDDAIAFFTDGQCEKSEFAKIIQSMFNVSALRQALEKGNVIPKNEKGKRTGGIMDLIEAANKE